jgi:hypothetical protein
MKSLLVFVSTLIFTVVLNAQALSYSDPAVMYNRILAESGNGTYTQIGTYRVVGNQFLNGGKLESIVFSDSSKKANQLLTSYDTYYQQLYVYEITTKQQITLLNVDSFMVTLPTKKVLTMVNTKFYNFKKKGFFQVVLNNENITLLKYYSTKLGFSSTNYVQPELREFDLSYTYYYYDAKTKTLEELPSYYSKIEKKLSSKVNIGNYVSKNAYNLNVEESLITIFKEYK